MFFFPHSGGINKVFVPCIAAVGPETPSAAPPPSSCSSVGGFIICNMGHLSQLVSPEATAEGDVELNYFGFIKIQNKKINKLESIQLVALLAKSI